MNILGLGIDENCQENLRPLFLMKWIAEQKLNKVEEKAKEEYAAKVLQDFENNYKMEYLTILTTVIGMPNINNKELVIEEIKKIDHNQISKISKNDFWASQILAKFKKFDESELKNKITELVEFLKNKEINFTKFIEDKKTAILSLDDNAYNTILNEEYEHYIQNNLQGDIDKIIYIYKNGLIILIDIRNKDYIIKFLDETSQNLVRDFMKEKQIPVFKTIYELLRTNNTITPESFIEKAPVIGVTGNEKALLYLFAEKQGITAPNTNFRLAKFYMTDALCRNYDKAISLYEKIAGEGVTEAYIELAKYYSNRKNLKLALENYEKAQKFGCSMDAEIQKLKAQINNDENASERLKPLLEIIEKYKNITKKDCYKITLEKDKTPEILDSKIGGNPYIPEGDDIPKDSNGEYMPLVIQINFAEIESEIYPKSGILEIFMDKTLGYPSQYAVRFYKEISDNYMKEFPKIDLSEFFYNGTSKIKLEKSTAYMPGSDFRTKGIVKNLVSEIINNHELVEKLKQIVKIDYKKYNLENYTKNDEELICELIQAALYDNLDNVPIMLGGYADFTQDDPREYGKDNRRNMTECLVKIDSLGDKEFYIGDSGIISVLISEEDLKNEKFENAVLDWDCC